MIELILTLSLVSLLEIDNFSLYHDRMSVHYTIIYLHYVVHCTLMKIRPVPVRVYKMHHYSPLLLLNHYELLDN